MEMAIKLVFWEWLLLTQLIVPFISHVTASYPFIIICFNFRYKFFSSPSKQLQSSPRPKVFKLIKKKLSLPIWKIKNALQEPSLHRIKCSGSGLQHCFNLRQKTTGGPFPCKTAQWPIISLRVWPSWPNQVASDKIPQ